jgi:hypothetical protein
LISKDPKTFLPIKDEITRQLERMLGSPDFNATPQQIALLKFVVNRTQEGNADSIKGYTVATEVFGRRSDFNQSIDPIVSIQASRLRWALAQYYETAGKNDPIRIDIPTGGYVPTFSKQRPDDQHLTAEQAATFGAMVTWPAILVRPLANLTANPEDDYLSIGLTAELAHALSHYQEIRVLEAIHRVQKSPHPPRKLISILSLTGMFVATRRVSMWRSGCVTLRRDFKSGRVSTGATLKPPK